MSLDVWLTVDNIDDYQLEESNTPVVYIREGGSTKSISIEEWNLRYPDSEALTTFRKPVVYTPTQLESGEWEVYSANITHNVNQMADAAGLYEVLWHPEDFVTPGKKIKAVDIIPTLERGLKRLKDYSEAYKVLNPSNGWGSYEGLVEFTENYLKACNKWPHAVVNVSI